MDPGPRGFLNQLRNRQPRLNLEAWAQFSTPFGRSFHLEDHTRDLAQIRNCPGVTQTVRMTASLEECFSRRRPDQMKVKLVPCHGDAENAAFFLDLFKGKRQAKRLTVIY